MIKYSSSKQIPIEDFVQPFGGKLSRENRWVLLANFLPWDEMVSVYTESMSKKQGRKAVDPRVAIGALIIKHILRLTDEDTIEFIKENPYLQYFLGYSAYRYEQPFTASLFVSIRRRLGMASFEKMTSHFLRRVSEVEKEIARKKREEKGKKTNPPSSGQASESGNANVKSESDSTPPNAGHLLVDATVAPSDIKYPTDLELLNEAREKSEQLIDMLYVPEKGKVKPRTYRRKAREDYLQAAKQRKKRKKVIRQALRKQLNYLSRNLKTIEKLLDSKEGDTFPLPYIYQRLYWIIQELYRQQKKMYDEKSHQVQGRIVSIFQPYVRPIVRGKSGSEVEFGAKLSLSLVGGYSYVDRVNWEAYNESVDLKEQIENYKARFGYYPEWLSADRIYATRENRSYMKSRGIKYSGIPLGRRKKELSEEDKAFLKERQRISRLRNQIEGKFGEGKRKYDLGLVKAKRRDTSESWIGMIYFVMNIAHFLRVIFCPFFKMAYLKLENLSREVYSLYLSFMFGQKKYRLATF